MDPGHPYTIYTLDLQAASTAEAIRISLRDFWELDVSNPDWEMLREALADPVYRDRHLISYHIEDYAKQFPEEARVFSSLAFAFNKLPGSGKVLFDSPEDLIKFPDSQSIASIFRRKTSPFWLKGRPGSLGQSGSIHANPGAPGNRKRILQSNCRSSIAPDGTGACSRT